MGKLRILLCMFSVALVLGNIPDMIGIEKNLFPCIAAVLAHNEDVNDENTNAPFKTAWSGSPANDQIATNNFPLYAMINTDNIYLYGIENNTSGFGMILFQEGQGTYFNWPDLVKYGWIPELSCFDYDKDGKKEIAVIVYSSKGTGRLETNLYILKPQKREWGDDEFGGYILSYEVKSLLSNDVDAWYTQVLMVKPSEDRKELVVTLRDQNYHINMNKLDINLESLDSLEGIKRADIIKFRFTKDYEIIVNIAVGFDFSFRDVSNTIFGNVEAIVHFNGSNFYLTDFKLVLDES